MPPTAARGDDLRPSCLREAQPADASSGHWIGPVAVGRGDPGAGGPSL